MAKIVILEKFKGELHGEFASIYVATDVNMNRYMTEHLKIRQEGDTIVNDVKGTKWKKIKEPLYNKIRKELDNVASVNYLASETQKKHETPGKESTHRRDKGFSI